MKEILYTVKYKMRGQWFWRRVRRVRGDGISTSEGQSIFRYLVTEDDTIIHLPLDAALVFGPERAVAIEKNMSKDAQQPIQRH